MDLFTVGNVLNILIKTIFNRSVTSIGGGGALVPLTAVRVVKSGVLPSRHGACGQWETYMIRIFFA